MMTAISEHTGELRKFALRAVKKARKENKSE
jgi:hypothetical protein